MPAGSGLRHQEIEHESMTMRIFTQKQKPTQQTKSANFTPARPHLVYSREVRPILHLQRVIGNQAVQRVLQTHVEELEVGLTATAFPRFGNDFSQIPMGALRACSSTGKRYITARSTAYFPHFIMKFD